MIRPDFNPDHWRFPRSSGLPIGYFDHARRARARALRNFFALAAIAAAIIAGVLLAYIVK